MTCQWFVKCWATLRYVCCLSIVQKWMVILTWYCSNKTIRGSAIPDPSICPSGPLASVDIFTFSDHSLWTQRWLWWCENPSRSAACEILWPARLPPRVSLLSQSLKAPSLPQSDHVDAPRGAESRGCSDRSWLHVGIGSIFEFETSLDSNTAVAGVMAENPWRLPSGGLSIKPQALLPQTFFTGRILNEQARPEQTLSLRCEICLLMNTEATEPSTAAPLQLCSAIHFWLTGPDCIFSESL